MIERFRTFLAGKKTYLTSASALLAVLIGFATGELGFVELVEGIFAALGLASLRAGITTETKRAAAPEGE